jgi:hypothetical protein
MRNEYDGPYASVRVRTAVGKNTCQTILAKGHQDRGEALEDDHIGIPVRSDPTADARLPAHGDIMEGVAPAAPDPRGLLFTGNALHRFPKLVRPQDQAIELLATPRIGDHIDSN